MSNDEEHRARPASIAASLFDEVRRAIQDIRQRVVEEGWFGRITTPLQRDHHSIGQTGPEAPAPERGASFEDLWPRHEGPVREPGHELDRGMDR
jgi:hypothetical protein